MLFPLTTRSEIESYSRARARAITLRDRVLCRCLGEYKVYCDIDDKGITPHLAMDGFWESWITLAVARYVRCGMRVINVGAHIGYFAVLLADLVGPEGTMTAFEPNRTNSDFLADSLRLNGMTSWAQVHTHAVSDGERQAYLNTPHGSSMDSVVSDVPSVERGILVQPVRTVSLDSFPWQGGMKHDFILCDAEGHEPRIFEGARALLEASPSAVILVEWSAHRYDTPQEYAKRLLDMGFHARFVHSDGALSGQCDEEFVSLQRQEMVWLSR